MMKCDFRQQMLDLDRQVPRYTSYPTAPHFAPLQNVATYAKSLNALADGEAISLYIHVPFCAKMCWYCGCHTKVTQRYEPIAKYVEALMAEITLVANQLQKPLQVSHLHFGGGSPGLLSAADFSALMAHLKTYFTFTDGAEIALELDPRHVDEDKVKAYAAHGVNRASLGVQDFDDTVLAAVNRQQPFELSQTAMALLNQYGIADINFDLLYGLPHQTVESMTRTIEQTLQLAPSRIALFGYAHVPWMKKHMRLIDETALPTKELRLDLFEAGQKMLQDAGYVSVGIDHFVVADNPMAQALKNKTLQRNFQGYTVDACQTLIGFGASAIGFVGGSYVQNEVNTGLYQTKVNNGKLAAIKAAALTADDHIRAAIIEQLMCYLEVDLGDICTRFNLPQNAFAVELESLQPYQGQGFLEVRGNKVHIFADAKPLTRLFASAFDAYLKPAESTAPRHARAI